VGDELQRAARAHAESVRRRFFDANGRLAIVPAKQSRKLAVYDLIAQRFVPGVRYTELEVNRELMQIYDDYVTLRRGLVDFGLMDRADGWYWRSGGTVDVGAARPNAGPVGETVGGPAGETAGVGFPGTTKPAGPAVSARGAARREAIVAAAAQLFAENGYAAVGMDDIGAGAGVTGPAIYRHFGAKAAVLSEVFDRVIDAVTTDPDLIGPEGGSEDGTADTGDTAEDHDAAAGELRDPATRLRDHVELYAGGVSRRRRLMAVFLREVHHLPPEHRDRLRGRQRALVGRWRTLLAAVHPDWSTERVRTAVHGVFGMLNAVGTFDSPLTDSELAGVLTELAVSSFRLPLLDQDESASPR